MPRFLDLDAWPRREHLELFRHYDHPFFSVCSRVDVTPLLELGRDRGEISFSLACYHLALTAAAGVEELRYRLRGNRVLVHDRLHASVTHLLPDDSFAICLLEWGPDFRRFQAAAREVLAGAAERPRRLDLHPERDDLVHFTVLPWLHFTAFRHAHAGGGSDSVPKIAFGRYRQDGDGRHRMPVAVDLHHALADGIHAARWVERFEELLAAPEEALGLGR